jgi:hypothetical protein
MKLVKPKEIYRGRKYIWETITPAQIIRTQAGRLGYKKVFFKTVGKHVQRQINPYRITFAFFGKVLGHRKGKPVHEYYALNRIGHPVNLPVGVDKLQAILRDFYGIKKLKRGQAIRVPKELYRKTTYGARKRVARLSDEQVERYESFGTIIKIQPKARIIRGLDGSLRIVTKKPLKVQKIIRR